MDDEPERLSRLPIRINRNTPELLEQQLESLLQRWTTAHDRKPATRSEWRDALSISGLNKTSIAVLFGGDNLSQLSGIHGYLAGLIPSRDYPVDERHLELLEYCRDNPGCSMVQFYSGELISEREVRKLVPELEKLGLLHRPHGERSGYYLTVDGRQLV